MNNLRKAMEMALEALELDCTDIDGNEVDLVTPAIKALRQALAQPEQEPDNWWDNKEYVKERFGDNAKIVGVKHGLPAGSFKQPQPKQEPVAWVKDGVLWNSDLPEKFTGGLYTAPPSKPWVSLTDEEMDECIKKADYNQGQYKRTQYWAHLATAIEAALKERNN